MGSRYHLHPDTQPDSCSWLAILEAPLSQVIGWAISKRIDRQLCIEALQMAIAARLDTRGFHHSDEACSMPPTTTSTSCEHTAPDQHSAKGPGDNAFVESFFKTLKYEEIHRLELRDLRGRDRTCPILHRGGLQSPRLHSSIGYRPPIEFEQLVTAPILRSATGFELLVAID